MLPSLEPELSSDFSLSSEFVPPSEVFVPSSELSVFSLEPEPSSEVSLPSLELELSSDFSVSSEVEPTS